MNDPAHQTESLRSYAASLGEPDDATTLRMRGRLDSYMQGRSTKRKRRWLVLAAVMGLVIVSLALVLWPRQSDGIITADETARVLEVAAGQVRLEPGSEIRVLDGDAGALELATGEVTVRSRSSDREVIVRSGAFAVRSNGGHFRVRATSEMPVVTVVAGEVRVLGPGLPAEGIRILPATPAGS